MSEEEAEADLEKPSITPQPSATSGQMSEVPNQPEEEELGGPKGPEPTRFGDWEKDGRCWDF